MGLFNKKIVASQSLEVSVGVDGLASTASGEFGVVVKRGIDTRHLRLLGNALLQETVRLKFCNITIEI